MNTRFKTRRLAALLALAGITNAAGFLAAQQPVRGTTAGTAGKTPRLLSNCDVRVQSCDDGSTLYGTGTTSAGSGAGSSESGGCGTGWRVMCRKDSTYRCLSWVPSTVGGTVGPAGGGGTTTMVCGESVTTVIILYWP